MTPAPPGQIDIWGRDAPPDAVLRANTPLSKGQREIIRLARRPEGVRAWEAGRIVHAHRDDAVAAGCRREAAHGPMKSGACCPYASSDGSDALKRLVERGVLIRVGTSAHRRYRVAPEAP